MGDSLFDVETDFALSQFNLSKFLEDEDKRGHLPYSLDLDDTEDFSLTSKQTNERFGRPATTDEVQHTMLKSFPANTVKNTNWGINTYDAWGRWRNEYVRTNGSSSSEQYTFVPPLNSELSAEELDFWLTKFVVEVSKINVSITLPPPLFLDLKPFCKL